MKHFIFYSYHMAKSTMRSHLDLSWRSLPDQFTLTDIKQGMFSASVNKKLLSAKKHGTMVLIRRKFGAPIFIKFIDKDALKADSDRRKIYIRALKKKLKLSSSNDFVKYLRCLAKFGKASRNFNLITACAVIDSVRKKI